MRAYVLISVLRDIQKTTLSSSKSVVYRLEYCFFSQKNHCVLSFLNVISFPNSCLASVPSSVRALLLPLSSCGRYGICRRLFR